LSPLLGKPRTGIETWTFEVMNRTFKYGLFLEAVVTFLLSALLIFLFVVKPVNRLRRFFEGDVPTTPSRQCPECRSNVPLDATRCAACTQPIPVG